MKADDARHLTSGLSRGLLVARRPVDRRCAVLAARWTPAQGRGDGSGKGRVAYSIGRSRDHEHGFTPPWRSAEHGFTPPWRSAEHGFTLVELMVALFVFGLIAAAGATLLGFSVRAQGAGAARLDDVSALERTAAILSADCAQAVNRPVRDVNGTTLPAFDGEGGSGAVPMLRLVRGGWTNLDQVPRPGLQRVEYRVENGALVRVAWPELDGAAPLPTAVILPHVRAAALRYRYAGAWSGRWDGAGGVALPQALELSLVRDDGRRWRMLFLVGTGYAPPPPGAANATI